MSNKKKSLNETHPQIAMEWDYKKNGALTPRDVTYGSHKKVSCYCKCGKSYEAIIKSRTLKGQGCPLCGILSRKLSIRDLEVLAKKKGGKLLSEVYINSKGELEWECKRGHRWFARPGDVKNKGSWCGDCSVNKKKTLKEMQKVAVKHGGECLSKEYKNMHSKLVWRCEDGHIWEAKPANIIHNNSWCPQCSPFLRENKCRFILEKLLGSSFPKNRKVLAPLELDGYSESLKLAFEYQGEQHYRVHYKFSRTEARLYEIQQTDNKKKQLCDKAGIRLIEIPFFKAETDKELLEFLISEIESVLEFVIEPVKIKTFSFEEHYINLSQLKELQQIAKRLGGKCLSNEYRINSSNLLWECAEGHQWSAPPKRIKNNSWCPYCANNVKLRIEDMKILAKNKGGKCLSETYFNSNEKLNWECAEGHQWYASANLIKNKNSWCPECSKNKKPTMDNIQAVAKIHGGLCLSKEYNDRETRLLWECGNGHQWTDKFWRIKSGFWCPQCLSIQQKNEKLKHMQEIAYEKGGECLAKNYENNKTPLEWVCKLGHRWFAAPQDITNKGSWCPKCSKRRKLTLEEMNEIAQKRGGECLSLEYKGGRHKLLWKCNKGHLWRATSYSVKNKGSWCPFCSHNQRKSIDERRNMFIN